MSRIRGFYGRMHRVSDYSTSKKEGEIISRLRYPQVIETEGETSALKSTFPDEFLVIRPKPRICAEIHLGKRFRRRT